MRNSDYFQMLQTGNCGALIDNQPQVFRYRPSRLTGLTLFTANSLNSAVYSRFVIFIIFLSCVSDILRHPWKTIFRGKVTLLAGTIPLWKDFDAASNDPKSEIADTATSLALRLKVKFS